MQPKNNKACLGLLVVQLLISPILVHAESSDTSKRLFALDDLTAFKSVGSPVFSPDGKWITYTISTNDVENEKSLNLIWMQPSHGGTPIPMTSADVSSRWPVFSKDGKKLYFLSSRGEKKSQVWSLNLEFGGEAQQVTDFERGISQITDFERGISQINFSSDQSKLLLVLRDKDEAEPLVEGSKPWVVDRLSFKADYEGYLNRLRKHIYIYEIETKKLSKITTGDHDNTQPAWSPDDSQIAFTSNRNPGEDLNSDIWLVDAKADARPRRLTSNTGEDSSPLWHPDGQWLLFRSARSDVPANYAITHLARINIKKPVHDMFGEKLDRIVTSAKFSTDGDHVYFLIEDSGEQHVARMGWDDGRVERLVTGQVIVSAFDLDKHNRVASIISSPMQAAELFIQDGQQSRQITWVNTELLNQLELGKTEEVHFKAPDGWDIEGFVTLPPNYKKGRRYPTILRIHGGPVGQYGQGFSTGSQLYAANGYVVIKTNPRGSSGYGQAFTTGLLGGWGEKDYLDVLAGVDHVIEMGYADPERLGMGGYSYGGILTNYLLGQTDRFKAAVSGAGSGHYLASYGHDMYRLWYEEELGLPWENRDLWERLSPFNHIHKATTPTLFIAGEKDWNVPVQGSEQLYQVMKRVGIEARLVVYPDEHHGGWSYANEKDAWIRRLGWYERFLKQDQ